MKRFSVLVILAMVLMIATGAMAEKTLRMSYMGYGTLHGAQSDMSKSRVDTLLMMGPRSAGAPYVGNFQDDVAGPDWNDWIHWDYTADTTRAWRISDYNADNLNGHGTGNLAAWCGLNYPSCDAGDPVGGYGNGWSTWLEWAYEVPDTNAVLNTAIDFYINYDLDPIGSGDNEDLIEFIIFTRADTNGFVSAAEFRGTGTNEHVSLTHRYYPQKYVNNDGDDLNNDVVFWIYFSSSPDVSDEDCGYGSVGACQVDDIHVNLIGLYEETETFEGTKLENSNWNEYVDENFVGDFANLAQNLGDLDDCRTNSSYQVNFVDTGFYEPELSPQQGLTYEYGPFGYIVQNQGGLTHDEDYHTHNTVRSPIMAWPTTGTYDGCLIEWTGYSHEELSDVSPGIFYTFGIRSTVSADPADIELAGFRGDGYVYYGGPGYINTGWLCSDQLVPGRTYVQIELDCWELGYQWGYDGVDGTPAPYFDNTKFYVFPVEGPTLTTRSVDIAQDNFPAIGTIDEDDLSANSIRFDMAQDVNNSDTVNVPGDSITFDITPVRAGAVLARAPRMYVAMKRNDLFDPYRSYLSVDPGNGLEYVEGTNPDGFTWAFDLPDTGFFFPGDVIHYFIEGIDHSPTSEWTDASATIPGDTTGFTNFSGPLTYPSDYVVHGLPSMWDDGGVYAYPPVLFWNDFEDRGGENEWHYALNNLGLNQGIKYDTYYSHGASSGVGNGLGGRATADQISVYTDMLYTAGTFSSLTLSNGETANQGDAGDDVGLLTSWMEYGDHDIFLTGDDLINDLTHHGADQVAFLNEYLGVTLVQEDLRPAIDGQAVPLVEVMSSQPVFATVSSWLAYGGCLSYNTFDGVTVNSGAVQLAQFLDDNGLPNQYVYSAATLYVHPTTNSRAITLPYDLMFVYDDPNEGAKAGAGLSARARLLNDVLVYFGVPFSGADATPAPEALMPFAVRNYPNPFNPTTKIEYFMPKAGHLSLKIYNVRGELVRTLVDGHADEGSGFVMWDGSNNDGAAQASGVYFYEARAAGEVKVSKMALVK